MYVHRLSFYVVPCGLWQGYQWLSLRDLGAQATFTIVFAWAAVLYGAVWLCGACAEKLGRAGPCTGGQPWARAISWAEDKLGSYQQTITRASQGYKSDAISHGLTYGLLSVNKSRKKLKVHKFKVLVKVQAFKTPRVFEFPVNVGLLWTTIWFGLRMPVWRRHV